MARIISVSVALTVGLLAGTPGEPGEERVLVERVVRPVVVEHSRCRSLTPSDLIVEEDGRECRVTAVTDETPPRLHAILVDNSLTMRPHMERLEKALARYVEALPADEPIVVATFADNLVLRSGLTTNREEVLRALRDIGFGYRTALRDALYWTMRYLEPRPERKVVVLFTDSFDNASLGTHSDEALAELARRDPNLSLFTVHLEGNRTQTPNAAALLERLSDSSGGEYFRIRGGGSLGKVYDKIRSRLDGELFVTYEPSPYGSGPLDDPARSSHRWRELDIRTRPDSRCAVTLPVTTRLAGTLPPLHAPPVVSTPSRANRTQPAALADVCPIGRQQCWSVVQELRFSGDSRLWLVTPPTYLAGRTLDVTADRGALYDARSLSESGVFRVDERAEAAWESRDFRVETPPLAQVEQENSLVDVLERWMRRGGAGPASFVHGQTWLEIRAPLAQAMRDARTDYRDFADSRLERSLDSVLAEWLGDVPALDLALGLEARIANRFLSLAEGERRTELERLDVLWSRLRSWFPPPTGVRVVVPLVPLYDPVRDVIGFQRVVLPRVTPSGGPIDDLPEYPLGARLFNRLLADRGLKSKLAGSVEVSGIEFRPVYLSDSEAPAPSHDADARDRPDGLPPYDAFEHTILLATDRGKASLIGFSERQPANGSGLALRCMAIDSGRSSSPVFDGIRSFLNESGLACSPGFEAIPIDASPPRR